MLDGRHTSGAGVHHQGRGGRQARGARGQSLVEFALTLPLLCYLMCAIIDLARVNLAWHRALTAIQYAEQMATDNSTSFPYDAGGPNTTAMVDKICNVLINDFKMPLGEVSDCEKNNVLFSSPDSDTFGGQKFTITVQFGVNPLMPISFRTPDGKSYNLFASYTVARQRTVRWNKPSYPPSPPA